MKYPFISIIIPTYTSSGKFIEMCITAINDQNYPKNKIEVIVVDNYSNDGTVKIAKRLGAKVYFQTGKPSQACNQRNLGAKEAKGKYLMFLDHDMEMSPDLLKNFAEKIKNCDNEIDAWYIPENIKASSWLLERIRNYERAFYNGTVIDAVRIIKKNKLLKTPKMYDPLLTQGPADWDTDIQLKNIGCKFNIIDKAIIHHEESMSFLQYIKKKTFYIKGGNLYAKKWIKNKNVTENIIKKQYGIYYRLFAVFFEKNKYKKVLSNPLMYLLVISLKSLIGTIYLVNYLTNKVYGKNI